LYRDGKFITSIAIAELHNGSIVPLPDNFEPFANLIKDFATYIGQTIKSSKRLAEMMAGKARLLSDVIEKAVTSDEANQENSTLQEQLNAFKEILIHDITPKGFADVYAQTIAYGMFAARLHDPTLTTFSRQEAAELIPKSNPFLRKLFGYIAGPDIDDRIKWIVDSLVEIFLACNVEEILKNYGTATKTENPIIHFYETFLSEYDPMLRKARGVWYTPHPIVSFIVRAVDHILKTEFNLAEGLADNSKTTIKVNLPETDKRYKENIKTIDQEVHRVQILDPATGTGTFLAEVVKHIYKKFEGMQGIWSNYVETHLLPRLNGFELLMASYAMAHLQMDLLFTETGYNSNSSQRLRVYLTNSLEEYHKDTGTLFANWLSTEANEANRIKRDTPVMVVIGNPPYAVSSSNKSIDSDGKKTWIGKLTDDYKKDLNERKINLDDDYIKFIRFGQYFINKNGSGVLAYISNNSFIDGITHRQMRKSLLETFDTIYILDLHGNAKKRETSADGLPDENVFDIMQGVSINIFIKTGNKRKDDLGNAFQFDLQGKRELKYELLSGASLTTISWIKLECTKPNFFFTNKDLSEVKNYVKGFKVDKIFQYSNSGLQTKNDDLTIHFNPISLNNVLNDLRTLESKELRKKYSIHKDGRDWTIDWAKRDVLAGKGIQFKIQYKPFDFRYSFYTGNSKGFLAYPRKPLTDLILRQNLALATMRQISGSVEPCEVLITKFVMTDRAMYSTNGTPYLFPLYLYPEAKGQQTILQSHIRTPNLNLEIVNQIAEKLNLTFTNEKETTKGAFAPIDILDYIYAVLHSPAYREKYKEFLKIDFPRVPYPKDAKTFWQLVKLGGELRQIHLLESPLVSKYITRYPIEGDNVVSKPKYENGKVFINDTQYFDGAPEMAWNFYIGGYQPAQKWLKDRKGRKLEFEDILHYQKIIVALTETDRLMKEVDGVKVE